MDLFSKLNRIVRGKMMGQVVEMAAHDISQLHQIVEFIQQRSQVVRFVVDDFTISVPDRALDPQRGAELRLCDLARNPST